MHPLHPPKNSRHLSLRLRLLCLLGLLGLMAGCRTSSPDQIPAGPKTTSALPPAPDLPHLLYTVSFPPVALSSNEFIQEVTLSVRDGRISSINRLPYDWAFECHWDNPGLVELYACAGHFPAGLQSVEALNGFVTVATRDRAQLQIEATLNTETAGDDPRPTAYHLGLSQLRLERVEDPAAQAYVGQDPEL